MLFEVLLKVPQAVTMAFANMCLGNLSSVYKRASEEAPAWSTGHVVLLYSNISIVLVLLLFILMHMISFLLLALLCCFCCSSGALQLQTFKLPTRVAQLGLRLVSDSLALAALRSPDKSGSVAGGQGCLQ